ncbi:MAG TPA: hypothetical protein VLW45_11575 [Pelomicrobium sp.]|nr:hypothetical protein [Pelomicrobium sp.]
MAEGVNTLVLVLLGLVAVTAYVTLVFIPSLKSAREERSRPLYSTRCSVRTGVAPMFHLSGLGRATFYDDFLVAVYLVRTELDYADIERIEFRRRILSMGMWLYPKGGRPRRYVALFPRELGPMVMILQAKGVTLPERP